MCAFHRADTFLPLEILAQGRVQAIDRKSDLALLQCDVPAGRKLPVAEIGHSVTLRAGEFVVALGSPKGLANTCTLGIVSATARPRSELGKPSVQCLIGIEAGPVE